MLKGLQFTIKKPTPEPNNSKTHYKTLQYTIKLKTYY